ncbi:complement component 1 Q subcomponent-binding protein, mitochondrial-like [Babylonia areolata]|uniref:complement component 1 Q subcomponent-binding protein, mitochondrial-like n=1 Tax=Babylonia areolata TaxID=304850 RepID=UPI003FCF199D
MSTMAARLRFALSASSKLVRCQSRLQAANHSTFLNSRHQQVLGRQISSAVAPCLGNFAPSLTAVKAAPAFKPQHRHLQTEVDKELSKFLDKEISYEESAANKPQARGVEGFEVSTNDADVTLTRKSGNETVVVKFSINASVDSEGPLAEGEQPAEMVSRPPFTVELSKGDGRTLSMQCVFVSPDEVDSEGGPRDAESIVDSFEIQEVALHSGEWKDTVYSVSSDIMDGNLYDLLMDMLDERGINEEFINQLVEYSTGYEHSRYLSFLKNLKSFAEK